MSIQQNFPAISPSLNLNFARSKTLDPRITFARPSTSGDATYMDANGLIVTAAADEPRFDHKYENGVIKSLGLLVEEQRSNLITYSDQLNEQSNWVDSGTSWSDNTIISPDGTQNADDPGFVSERWGFYDDTNSSWISGYPQNYPFTVTSEWVRHSATITTPSGCTTLRFYPLRSGDDISYIFQRVGVSTSTTYTASAYYKLADDGTTVIAWGAQLETGAFPTSYIPTTASTATRNPDNVSITGDNFSDVYNQEEGSYKVEGVINGSLPANTYGGIFGAGGGSSTSNFIFYNPGTSFGQYVCNTGQSPASTLGKTYTVGSKFKISASYATNDFACSLNGDISTSTTSNALYKSHTYFRIGSNPISFAVRGAMTISNISYYSKQIKDTQLKTLTK